MSSVACVGNRASAPDARRPSPSPRHSRRTLIGYLCRKPIRLADTPHKETLQRHIRCGCVGGHLSRKCHITTAGMFQTVASCLRAQRRGASTTSPASFPTSSEGFSEVCRASGRRTRAANYSFDDHKRQLPTKRIGLGLLLALAIRGLPHGGRLTVPSRLKRTRLRASCPEPRGSCSGWSGPCRTQRRLGPAGLAYLASGSGGSGLPPAPRHDGPRHW